MIPVRVHDQHPGSQLLGREITKEYTRVVKNGNSLVVRITRLCKEMGIKDGDFILIDVKKAEVNVEEEKEADE